MKLRAHDVAQNAYKLVEARLNFDKKKEYGSLAHKLPVLILQNGLAQAAGFLLAKSEAHHQALLDDLASVLGIAGRDELHRQVIAADVTQTMLLTRRSLEAAGWIKRYVQGLLKVSSTGDNTDEKDKS
jgi:CRISPR-associated protein Cmr5